MKNSIKSALVDTTIGTVGFLALFGWMLLSAKISNFLFHNILSKVLFVFVVVLVPAFFIMFLIIEEGYWEDSD